MFIDRSSYRARNGKVYTRVLLRSSYREGGKVKHRTLGNLSGLSEFEIDAISKALKSKGKEEVTRSGGIPDGAKQGPSVGALIVLESLAKEMGLAEVLGKDRQGKLALWQVISRVLDQGSRLSAVRAARDGGAAAVLGLTEFNEDHLYSNLQWLEQEQKRIEDGLFSLRNKGKEGSPLFLYDVTSTYLEGEQNAFAAFGYNRDGKKSKKQIVVGLLCDEQGIPVSIEVFDGNTADTKTVPSQIEKLTTRFGGGSLTLVGDRGMIRQPQKKELEQNGLHYITAITKSQIQTLIKKGVFQVELFDNDLAEVQEEVDGKMLRYVLRRNPVRADEIERCRNQKKATVEKFTEQTNAYLATHPRAKSALALSRVQKKIASLKLGSWLKAQDQARCIILEIDQQALKDDAKLDGCYALCTDLAQSSADAHLIAQRYKSLTLVESSFRTSKTVELEMRPVHVRSASSTRGHMLVVMLAYLLTQELAKRWSHLDMTVHEALDLLKTYCAIEIAGKIHILLEPSDTIAQLLTSAKVTLPKALCQALNNVSTKRKLQKSRYRRLK